MTIAQGIFKQLIYKKEASWGVAPVATGAQRMKRITSDLSLGRSRFQGQQITTSQQVRVSRAGTKRAQGTVTDELSPGAWEDFMGSALRRLFTARAPITGLSITIAGAGPTWTITRAAGDWFAGNVLVGHVGRLTAGTFNVANSNKNLRVLSMSATVLTVATLDGSNLVAEGPIASSTFTLTGKDTFTPATGHIDESYTIEHFFSDIVRSEYFTGCKIENITISVPASGMATITARFLGKDMVSGAAAYFTTPTAEISSESLSSSVGAIRVGAVDQGVVTGLTISIDTGANGPDVAFSATMPGIFLGRVRITGSFTAFYESAAITDAFVADSFTTIAAVLTTSAGAASDFVSFILSQVKLGSASKSDGETGVIQTVSWEAVENTTAGAGAELTTMVVQDSLA